DLLVGFNRMFRAPVCAEDAAGPRARRPPLRMLGLRRRQDASYFAVRLPWDWQLWGLDPGARGLDYRQESFFRGLGRRDGDGDGDGDGAPAKLIVCQPTPPVAFGRVVADRHALRDLIDLGLPAPFLAADARRVDGHPAPSPAELPRALPDGHCRLDLAGDMHYYARFAAADAPPGAATTGDYACVVSGGGGAFHHPSFTDFGDLPARATFPTPAASRRAVADRLFRPWTVFNGGTVNVAAFLVAVVLCAGSLWSGTRTVTDWLFLALGVRGERGLGGGATAALPPAAWPSLGGAAVFLGSIVAAVILVLAAVRYARWVNRMLHTPRRRWTWTMRALRSLPVDRIFEERGYLPSWLLVLIAAALPPLAPQLADALVGGAPSGAAMLFQAVFLSVLFGLGLALVPFAVGSGGEYHRPTERGVFVVLGVGHTAFQLLLPLVMVRVGVGAPIGLAAALVVEAMLVTVGWHLLRRGGPGARWPALAVWLGHGPLLIAILLLAGHGTLARPSTVAGTIAVVLAAGALGSVLGCVEYGWYLGVASGWNGHNNEAGATSRLERFRQFIRFRLERDRLTGYVIAVDEPGTDPTTVAPRVVDV
ncbi:MAG: hypothetical protein KC464_36155, partial [Myxococcales bacterium]|nr:hypothetical protein [Myxococcales bacterium]